MSNETPTPRPELVALTSSRFIAAMLVVLYHTTQSFSPKPAWLVFISPLGQAVVGYFFALSGFVLAYTYRHRFTDGVTWPAFVRFYRARLARAFPLHVVVMIMLVPVVLHFQSGAVLSHPWRWGTWLVQLGLLQALFPSRTFIMDWNLPSWSISCELAFGLFFPSLLGVLVRGMTTERRSLAWVGGLWVGGAALAMGFLMVVRFIALGHLDLGVDVMSEGWFLFSPVARFGEFAAGCALGCWYLSALERPADFPVFHALLGTSARRGVWAVGSVVVALAVCNLPVPNNAFALPFYRLQQFSLLQPMVAALILGLAAGPSLPAKLLDHPWLKRLGDASFAIYIFHWVAAYVFLRLKGSIQPEWQWPVAVAFMVSCPFIALELDNLIVLPARAFLLNRWNRAPQAKPEEAAAAA